MPSEPEFGHALRSHNGEQESTTLPSDIREGQIATLAYQLWQARGCPQGSPDEDWFRAEAQLCRGEDTDEAI